MPLKARPSSGWREGSLWARTVFIGILSCSLRVSHGDWHRAGAEHLLVLHQCLRTEPPIFALQRHSEPEVKMEPSVRPHRAQGSQNKKAAYEAEGKVRKTGRVAQATGHMATVRSTPRQEGGMGTANNC